MLGVVCNQTGGIWDVVMGVEADVLKNWAEHSCFKKYDGTNSVEIAGRARKCRFARQRCGDGAIF